MPESKALVWDQDGERLYETGVDKGVLFPYSTNSYEKGVAWNGLTSVQQSPDGAEATSIYADNIKYLTMRSVENYKGTIGAYMSPPEFDECDGSAKPTGTIGLKLTQQKRKPFGFSYRTKIGNDTMLDEFGYKIHLVYGATASPSERNYQTTNESPEAAELSWEFECTPVVVPGFRPVAHLEIDSTQFKTEAEKALLKALEDKIYGTSTTDSSLPLPEEVIAMLTPNA